MDSNNIILAITLLLFGFLFNKYFPLFLKKINYKYFPNSGLLIDNEFSKPQAFHERAISVTGGISIYFSYIVAFIYFFFSNQTIYFQYISFCSLFFLLGLIDDFKINVRPKFRLIAMIMFLVILIINNNFYIEKTGIEFINRLLEIDIFALFFICLCFLFIINGSNLIDGFNGLLGIHSLIIFLNLFFINYLNGIDYLANLLIYSIIILIPFLVFNFPKAKIFLGDSGSYFLGAFIAVAVIQTSIENPQISPFYFCILLFYLFFEVFFSFIRKVLFEKKSPLFPDKKHLHMLLYENLFNKNKNKLKSNYSVSVIVNLIYFVLTIPAIFMMKNGLFCKYYSLVFFIIYLFSYKACKNKINKFK